MITSKPVNPVKYLIFLVLLLLVFGFVFIDQTRFLLDVTSFVVVFVPSLFLIFMTYSGSELVQAIKAPFQKEANQNQLKMARGLFEAYTKYCLALGVFFTITGWIIGLIYAGSPANAIGAYISISLLTMFYSLLFIMVFSLPLRTAVVKRLQEAE